MLEGVCKNVAAAALLAFEALLFINSCEHSMVDEVSLNQVVDQAIQLRPTMRQYSSLADMVLCAVSVVPTQEDGQEEQGTRSRLSPMTAAQILAKLIQRLRSHSDYDADAASRWIRCVVQIVLDGRCSDEEPTSAHDAEALKTVHLITQQALILARSGSDTNATMGRDEQNQYPTEELEWLSTTLFNLSIDLYISQTEPGTAPQEPELGGNIDSADTTPDIMNPQMWASKAVEFADLLASPTPLSHAQQNDAGVGGAGRGLLARILRERCEGLGWHV